MPLLRSPSVYRATCEVELAVHCAGTPKCHLTLCAIATTDILMGAICNIREYSLDTRGR
jgi:hypothetical protein